MTEGVVRPGGSPLAFPEGKAGRGPSGLREEVGVPRGAGTTPRSSDLGDGWGLRWAEAARGLKTAPRPAVPRGAAASQQLPPAAPVLRWVWGLEA